MMLNFVCEAFDGNVSLWASVRASDGSQEGKKEEKWGVRPDKPGLNLTPSI